MDTLHVFLVLALVGVASCSYDPTSGSELTMTVRPGDNITLHCDCKRSSGVFIVWYRNCSHRNQPSLVLKTQGHLNPSAEAKETYNWNNIPRQFTFVRNVSSESYDLQITNITESDGGLYFCGTERMKVEDKEKIITVYFYEFGNITTRILVNSSSNPHPHPHREAAAPCWILLFSLCPVVAFLSSFVSSILVYLLCQKKEKEHEADQHRPPASLYKDEDVIYAALEMHQSKRTKRKKIQDSDLSSYSTCQYLKM